MQQCKFIRFLLVFLAMLCIVACEYDIIVQEKIIIPPDQEISFSQDIVPIFNSKCVECHNGGVAPDLREANAFSSLISGNYINTGEPANSTIYTTLLEGSHNDRATSTEKQLILEWITRGAKNN